MRKQESKGGMRMRESTQAKGDERVGESMREGIREEKQGPKDEREGIYE